MTDELITGLTAILGDAVAEGDEFAIVDVSDPTLDAAGTTKRITADEAAAAFSRLAGFGKYVEVGYNNEPTWIDPAGADWADVVANNLGWWQIAYTTYGGDAFAINAGTGDGTTNRLLFEVFSTGVDFIGTNGDGSVAFNSTTSSGSNITVSAAVGQTDPVLDVGPFTVAPDGKVGGVTPSPGWVIKWNGTNWVASAP